MKQEEPNARLLRKSEPSFPTFGTIRYKLNNQGDEWKRSSPFAERHAKEGVLGLRAAKKGAAQRLERSGNGNPSRQRHCFFGIQISVGLNDALRSVANGRLCVVCCVLCEMSMLARQEGRALRRVQVMWSDRRAGALSRLEDFRSSGTSMTLPVKEGEKWGGGGIPLDNSMRVSIPMPGGW